MPSVSLAKLVVIFVWIASSMGGRCRWQAENFCQTHTCDDVHYMWRSHSKDSNQSVFFCPKSKGRDVVLCEHPDWSGECYASHHPIGQKCTNVDPEINDKASSVHTLQGCVLLYDEADCQGKWKVFDKGTAGHNSLLEMNDMVSSVGLCTKENWIKECNEAAPAARLECSVLRKKIIASRREILKSNDNDKNPFLDFPETRGIDITELLRQHSSDTNRKPLNVPNFSIPPNPFDNFPQIRDLDTAELLRQHTFTDQIPIELPSLRKLQSYNPLNDLCARNPPICAENRESEEPWWIPRRRRSWQWLVLGAILGLIYGCFRYCLCPCLFKEKTMEPEPELGQMNSGPRGASTNLYSYSPPLHSTPGVFVVDERGYTKMVPL